MLHDGTSVLVVKAEQVTHCVLTAPSETVIVAGAATLSSTRGYTPESLTRASPWKRCADLLVR